MNPKSSSEVGYMSKHVRSASSKKFSARRRGMHIVMQKKDKNGEDIAVRQHQERIRKVQKPKKTLFSQIVAKCCRKLQILQGVARCCKSGMQAMEPFSCHMDHPKIELNPPNFLKLKYCKNQLYCNAAKTPCNCIVTDGAQRGAWPRSARH